MSVVRVEHGRIVEEWEILDRLEIIAPARPDRGAGADRESLTRLNP